MIKEYTREAEIELIEYAVTALQEGRGDDVIGCELHHEIFNTDYYIIGTFQAKEWIDKMFGSAFNAIDFIQTYEKANFGETNTDISDAEKVCNMAVYIIGEHILDYDVIDRFWDKRLSTDDVKEIIEELENL